MAKLAYRRLFELRLLHQYWLDEGATRFDDLSSAVRDARLLAYDVRSFLSIRPTPDTGRVLRGSGCVFVASTLGLIVGAPASLRLEPATVLRFVVTVTDGRFFDYSAMTFRRQRVHAVTDSDGITHRYKENVPVLSNLTGAARGAGAGKTLYLSRESPGPTATDRVEQFVRTGATLMQLTSDDPGAAIAELGPAADLPAYLNQADSPAITPPAGAAGVPARGVELSGEIPEDVFAVIELTGVRPDDGDFSFLDAAGAPTLPPPVFEVRIKNRSTYWRYRKRVDGSVVGNVVGPLPLTHFGNAGTRQKPAGVVNAEMTGAKVNRLVSEIYI